MTASARLVRDDDPDRALTTAEAAALLGVAKRTVRRRVEDGSLPTTRVGRCLRFRRSDLVAFMAANTATR